MNHHRFGVVRLPVAVPEVVLLPRDVAGVQALRLFDPIDGDVAAAAGIRADVAKPQSLVGPCGHVLPIAMARALQSEHGARPAVGTDREEAGSVAAVVV